MIWWQSRDILDMFNLSIDVTGWSKRGRWGISDEFQNEALWNRYRKDRNAFKPNGLRGRTRLQAVRAAQQAIRALALRDRVIRQERFVHALSRMAYRKTKNRFLEIGIWMMETVLIAPWANPLLALPILKIRPAIPQTASAIHESKEVAVMPGVSHEKVRKALSSSRSDHAAGLSLALTALGQSSKARDAGIRPEHALRSPVLSIGLETGPSSEGWPFSPENLITTLRKKGVDIAVLDPRVTNDPSRGYVRGYVQDMAMFADNAFKAVVSVGVFDPNFAEVPINGIVATQGFVSALEFYWAAATEIRRLLEHGHIFTSISLFNNPLFVSVLNDLGFKVIKVDKGMYVARLDKNAAFPTPPFKGFLRAA
jgi:hypothetical protein